jgi:hypothetical protein
VPETTIEIGQYRAAHRVREGWQIRFLPTDEDGTVDWLTVTSILRIYSPLNMVRFTFGEDGSQGVAHDTDVFCRTTAEIRRAEAAS